MAFSKTKNSQGKNVKAKKQQKAKSNTHNPKHPAPDNTTKPDRLLSTERNNSECLPNTPGSRNRPPLWRKPYFVTLFSSSFLWFVRIHMNPFQTFTPYTSEIHFNTNPVSHLLLDPPRDHFPIGSLRGELSYLAPLGSENISAPYFKQCFFGRGIPPQTESNTTPPSPKTEITNILFYILNFSSIITFKM